ncbi:MAG: hypothetical protein LBU90_08560 [Bacteroidales bacterium]|jgi:uncharacterized protein involved in exopolysaccharide biosynthesis|nr:hypothetical protein [Bacteroidales bacterium]
MEQKNERYSFNSNDLLFKIYLYKKPLIIVSAVAFVVSLVVSFCITPLYEASSVIFPAPSTPVGNIVTTATAAKKESVFGEVKEAEQLLQVLNSEEIRNKIIRKFNLWEHYDIDSARVSSPRDKMNRIFNNRIQAKRTTYGAVEIRVLDADPQTAATMANTITAMIDTVMNQMEKARAREAFAIAKKEYESRVLYLTSLEDSLQRIMQKGVIDFESQSLALNQAYGEALASGNAKGAAAIRRQLDTLARYGSTYISLRDFLEYQKEQLSILTSRFREAEVEAHHTLTHFYVVERATVPDKKAKPQRALIVIVSTFASFIFTFLVLVFVEFFKDLRRKEQEINHSESKKS